MSEANGRQRSAFVLAHQNLKQLIRYMKESLRLSYGEVQIQVDGIIRSLINEELDELNSLKGKEPDKGA